jgi:hypothetical protein
VRLGDEVLLLGECLLVLCWRTAGASWNSRAGGAWGRSDQSTLSSGVVNGRRVVVWDGCGLAIADSVVMISAVKNIPLNLEPRK